ncbi:EamA family transporter [Phaeobacter sp. 11ANDIMAR09]|uniref:EamA family transporter n=1 Tax=Phaeobacter sp. 11ANDIMAR09 TaxID=1225647 RepID=UPI0006C88870|nr:EamA family transporter [Phaeobacter sp. 11ANDIMAR09]KPD11647.1 ABC transporter permease [Phaeobacter sp. 11ANDIMAR09]
MTRMDLLYTALAPAIWGSSYIVTTSLLPGQSPLLVALLRALPAGLILLLFVRQLPSLAWMPKLLILAALNFSLFWTLLFVSAYRLPGGVAATLGAAQPLLVVFFSAYALKTPIRPSALLAAALSIFGVALLVLTPAARLDLWGILAGLGGAASMAAGVVLSRKWQPPVPPLTFTAWQLTAGGLLLLPFVAPNLGAIAALTATNLIGLAYMSLIGGALTYVLWFRGLARIEPAKVSLLGVLSPLTAVILGWVLLAEDLTAAQIAGATLALFSLWLGQSDLNLKRRSPA